MRTVNSSSMEGLSFAILTKHALEVHVVSVGTVGSLSTVLKLSSFSCSFPEPIVNWGKKGWTGEGLKTGDKQNKMSLS